MSLITLPRIQAAAEVLAGVLSPTPMEQSAACSALAGGQVVLKCEHLQRTGSFKVRGAFAAMAQLDPAARARGVVCASAGNHAQGVAFAAQRLGIPATVVMPEQAALPKVEATRAYGAEVVLAGLTFDDAYEVSRVHAEATGATYLHPFDDLDVIAGQATLGLDILAEVPDVATIVVPIGGGGLAAGVASAVRLTRPGVWVVGVQAEGAAAFPPSLAAGAPRTLPEVRTFADGIAVRRPGVHTLAHVAARVDEVVTVSDEDIARAVLLLVERAKQVVEPAGAAGLAALLSGAAEVPFPAVAVLCGGNVDPLLLSRILQSGMFEEGRFFALRTALADRPGALGDLLTVLAAERANILSITHHRMRTRLGVTEVEVELELETRGPEHIAAVLAALRAASYPVR